MSVCDPRAHWEALLADPHRDDLAAELETQLDAELRRARQAVGGSKREIRARALGRLIADALVLHHVRRWREPFTRGPYLDQICAGLGRPSLGDDDHHLDLHDANDGADALDPHATFDAWDVEHAAAGATAEARAVWVDRALSAYEAIVAAPRDPGNDLGPLGSIVDLMDLPQVRRAWTLDRRMAAEGWRPNWTAAFVLGRWAALGETAAAQAATAELADADLRALALGRIAGSAPHGDPAAHLDAPPQCDVVNGDGLAAFVRGLTQVLGPETRPPSPQTITAVLAKVRTNPRAPTRNTALVLLESWYEHGDAATWHRAIADLADSDARVHALFALAQAQPNAPQRAAVVRDAVRSMFALPRPATARWLGENVESFMVLPRPEARAVVADIFVAIPRDGSMPLASLAGADLAGLLAWLDGEQAVTAAADALQDALVRWA